jgi:hypothetical protein
MVLIVEVQLEKGAKDGFGGVGLGAGFKAFASAILYRPRRQAHAYRRLLRCPVVAALFLRLELSWWSPAPATRFGNSYKTEGSHTVTP